MVAVIASIFRSWFDCSTGPQLTTNGRYIEAFIFAVRLTAFAFRGEKERFLAKGFDGYLSKPLDSMELLAEMKRHLSHEFKPVS